MNDNTPELLAGIDYGRRRIGIALSDRLGLTAQPFQQIEVQDLPDAVEKIAGILVEREIDRVIYGMPVNMDGTVGEMGKEVETFADMVSKQADIPYEFFDERLTSAQAHGVLKQANYSGKKKKQKLDMISAQIMLQSCMDSKR
ncbi:Holliday junction resolvase RuvX [Planctomycetota bacterium]